MTHFLHQPQGIFLRSDEELLSVGKNLPIGTYVVSCTPLGEFYLSKIENFKRPSKTYGTVGNRAARIMATFADRDNSTGVLLSGEQGSGKTMLARELSLLAAEKGIATIIVNSPYCGANFNQFIQMINIPAVVIFDEFEKMYDDDDQEKMLTLLDGLFPSKKLFVLTCNNVYRIDQHLLNRPGRIFYHLKYDGLEVEFIREYCADVLKNKAHAKGVEHVSRHFFTFNFDMLKAIVEEMNRFDIEASEAVEMLNVSPATNKDFDHAVELKVNGVEVKNLYDSEFSGNPLSGESVVIRPHGRGEDEPELVSEAITHTKHGMQHFVFAPDDLVDISDNVFTFVKGNAILRLTRKVDKKFKYMAF